jgi:threonine dehydratase
VLKGDSPSAAREAADALARERGSVLVHPYDDPDVIAGQGTVALELLADRPDLDTLVVPIGGGGLISGIAVAAKALKPEIEIVGVQSTLYPSMYRLLRGEDPGPPSRSGDLGRRDCGLSEPGRLTRRIVQALVRRSGLVDEIMLEGAVETPLRAAEASWSRGAGRRRRRRARGTRALLRPAGRDRSPAATWTRGCSLRS